MFWRNPLWVVSLSPTPRSKTHHAVQYLVEVKITHSVSPRCQCLPTARAVITPIWESRWITLDAVFGGNQANRASYQKSGQPKLYATSPNSFVHSRLSLSTFRKRHANCKSGRNPVDMLGLSVHCKGDKEFLASCDSDSLLRSGHQGLVSGNK